MEPPWEHPDWYDLHDTAFTAGSEREPEHYRELLLALPPLGESDHLVDIGAGTGKLSHLIARGYPELGRVTLIEPNEVKLRRARARLAEALPVRASTRWQCRRDRANFRRRAMRASPCSAACSCRCSNSGTWRTRTGVAWVDRALAEAAALLQRSPDTIQ